MYHPEIARMLVSTYQAEIRRAVADERRFQAAFQRKRRYSVGRRNRLERMVGMVRARWYAHRHRLAQRRYASDWRIEILAIAQRHTPCGSSVACRRVA